LRARQAVKVERAGGLLHLARDVGRIEKAAGGRAALMVKDRERTA
jgi:hypothetical protein